MNFKEQYRHPKWQEKRLLVLQHNNFMCQECGEKDKELHVHHPYYLKDTKVWDYPTEVLKCLCFTCHEKVHALDDKIKRWLSELPYDAKFIAFTNVKSSVENYLKEKKPEELDYRDCRENKRQAAVSIDDHENLTMAQMLAKLMGEKK